MRMRCGEALDDRLVARVDRRRVAEAAVLGDELAGGDRVLDRRRAHEAEHRHQLLAARSGCAASSVEVGGQRRDEDLVASAGLEAGQRGEVDARAPERLPMRARPSSSKAHGGERVDLVRRQHAGAHALELGDDARRRSRRRRRSVCSAGQITDASKVLEIRMSTTAIGTSALRCR